MTKKITVQTTVDFYLGCMTAGDVIEHLSAFPSNAVLDNWGDVITISYFRDETDEEYEARLAEEKRKEEIQKEWDEKRAKQFEKEQYATYLILKQRFEK